ncbi:MAG TPA: spondin domain-containing protein [Vicinamibacterales bacterium]|nr:spondin domain-containing protein [Vicinamibacterales bacterium]
MMRLALGITVTFLLAGCGNTTSPSSPTATPAQEPGTPPPPAPAATARYRVTFRATWSEATHPDRFPNTPHFSPLVGATHDAATRFWEAGGIASEGIERMAELGSVSPLDDTIRTAIDQGGAQFLLLGGGIARSPGEVSLEFDIGRDFPYVTLVSMVAPSPDWFVGISAANFLASGDWPGEIVFELFPYDAGTDNGSVYTAPDDDSNPQDAIRRITGFPFTVGGVVAPMGTFTFTRLP